MTSTELFTDTHGRSRRLRQLGARIDELSDELGAAVEERDELLEAASASDAADHEHKRLRQAETSAKTAWTRAATTFTERCRELGVPKLGHADPKLTPLERHELRGLAEKVERSQRHYRTATENLASFEIALSQKRADATLLDVERPAGPTLGQELDRLDERIRYYKAMGAEKKVGPLSAERLAVLERYNDIQRIELEKLRRRPERKKGNGKG